MTNDIIHDIDHAAPIEIVDRPVPLARRLYANPSLRRLGVVVLLGVIWQAYGVILDNPLLFPRLSDTLVALGEGVMSGEIPKKVLISLRVLLMGVGVMAPMVEKEVVVEPTTGDEEGCSSVVFLKSLLGSDVESVGRVDSRGGQAGSRQDQLGEL